MKPYDIGKRCLDVVGAGSGLLLVSPLLGVVALAIVLDSGTPILFRQPRAGHHGAPFTIYKFRTMRAPRPGEDMLASDGLRLSRLGRFLRATSLDELPTLWNVLKGDMSLVGPRPLLLRYVERYSAFQARRHEVKPGVTGWAQIHGRNALDWARKFELDVWYVDHRSHRLDLEILAATVLTVFKREGVTHGNASTMPEFWGSNPPEDAPRP
ncbi:MAG: sugar transferase [Myxococcota bacterium]